jgi:hypothetical protein
MDFQLAKIASEAGGRSFFLSENGLWPPVAKLPQPQKIHENTLISTGCALKHSFEFSTAV